MLISFKYKCIIVLGCSMNPDAKRLYDDLLSNYNKLVRPVLNNTDPLPVRIKLKLSQLIDIVSYNKNHRYINLKLVDYFLISNFIFLLTH